MCAEESVRVRVQIEILVVRWGEEENLERGSWSGSTFISSSGREATGDEFLATSDDSVATLDEHQTTELDLATVRTRIVLRFLNSHEQP